MSLKDSADNSKSSLHSLREQIDAACVSNFISIFIKVVLSLGPYLLSLACLRSASP